MRQSRSRKFDPMAIESLLNEDDDCSADNTGSVEQRRDTEPSTRPRAQTTRLPEMSRPTVARRETDPVLAQLTAASTSETRLDTSSTPEWQPYRNPKSPSTPRRQSGVRGPQPKYTIEQVLFIWYHRTDLGEPWDQVLEAYRVQFSQSRPKGGLQCKFYRLLEENKVEKVRAQTRSASDSPKDRVGKYGVVQRTTKRFKWMRYEHFHAPPLPQFSGDSVCSSIEQSCCSGCSDCGSP